MSPAARAYGSPSAFRQALEELLRARASREGVDLNRLRRLVAIDRLLARLFADGDRAPWLVKGGYCLEVRYQLRGRATKDVDLAFAGADPAAGTEAGRAAIRDALQSGVARDVGDPFQLTVAGPPQEMTGAPEGGHRFHVAAALAGRLFDEFRLDVVLGEPVSGTPDRLVAPGYLAFAGIPATTLAAVPVAQQFADKVHAFTRPRQGFENTRVRDLVDLALMIEGGLPGPEQVRAAVDSTFAHYATHPIPEHIPPPARSWEDAFGLLARESSIGARTPAEAHALLHTVWTTLGFSQREGHSTP